MELKPGSRWKSSVCDVEVVIVRAPKTPVTLECGGQPLSAHTAEKPQGLELSPDHSAGCQVGKRYVDEETGLEVLCSKGGKGSLSVNGRPITVKEAKKLPSSD